MLTVIGLVLLIPALAILALSAFFALEVVAAFFFRSGQNNILSARGDMVVLIPAHDEEAGITATIEDVKRELLRGDRIVVIADNCTDSTVSVARRAGAEVIERNEPSRRGKGYALQFGIDHLRARPPDAVVFIDADCRVEEGALSRIAARAAAAARPVQALYLMNAPASVGARAAVAAFAWILMNRVRMSGLQRLAGFSRLTGSGMAFPWDLISTCWLATDDIVEDLAITVKMVDRGAAPLLDLEARVVSEFSKVESGAARQRARWELGSLATANRKVPGLFLKGLGGEPAALFLALDLAIPPITVLTGSILVGLILSAPSASAGFAAPFIACAAAAAIVFLAVAAAWAAFGRAVLPLRALGAIGPFLHGKLDVYGREGRRSVKTWTRADRGDAR